MDRYICIHGHFYQPPRENPWLEAIEVQDSAYPFHDWNERINAECYAPNTASRIVAEDRIIDIVNNYSKISFNFGPTLLSWMEGRDTETYQAILDADRKSRDKFSGHGSALAQAYNHMIMPLANDRDKYTQVVWGIRDFRYRFGREPEGMWLPETAVDLETLDIMADQGIKFTILAPRQAKRIRPISDGQAWESVEGGKIDPTRPYVCLLPSGRHIALFFYDGPISQGIAFENILISGETFANRLIGAFNGSRTWPQLVNVATDGETYGHHHRFGDMALAHCVHHIESNDLAKITNYSEYLEKNPPDQVVEIFENSSWSCIHGVERWKENCGCNSGMHGSWHQAWRAPLREALDWLRNLCIPLFENEGGRLLKDPWAARNDYIDVILDRSLDNVNGFLQKHASKDLSPEEKVRALLLLSMQRCSMLMYTSCGWFFDEISGIETVQVLDYASRMIQLAQDIQQDLSIEAQFIERLARAPSNVLENGAKVYEMYVDRKSVV
jgi:alpha-amylase/alpha-mannosidase (GH57 family)